MYNSIKRKINWERENLWRGCMLSSIAHAIMVAHYPLLSHEQSWDGMNYSVQVSSKLFQWSIRRCSQISK